TRGWCSRAETRRSACRNGGGTMTREARMMCGIILITVPTIQYGGYFLLTSLMNKSSGYMDNPLRQNFFRAGHAHAGVVGILFLGAAAGCNASRSSGDSDLRRSTRSRRRSDYARRWIAAVCAKLGAPRFWKEMSDVEGTGYCSSPTHQDLRRGQRRNPGPARS